MQSETRIRIAMAQANLLVGDIEGNASRVIDLAIRARDQLHAQAIIFPELTLSSYPPEDLLLRAGLYMRIERSLQTICQKISGIDVILGYPKKERGGTFNMAGLIHDGKVVAEYRKQHLPNYSVFDEKRYFDAGTDACVVEIAGVPMGITICEDAWNPGPMRQSVDAGARLLLNLNASPFHMEKGRERERVLQARVGETGVPIVYVNLVGGQDELVFDGESFVMDAHGEICWRAPAFEEDLYTVDFTVAGNNVLPVAANCAARPGKVESAYQALVLGVRDYVNKNGFRGAVIGLSGGIDSALTLAVAVDALGADRVEGVSMPSRYTADMSIEDARTEAQTLGVEFHVIAIEPVFNAFLDSLKQEFAGKPVDTTEENIQARCRGVLLMAISNKKGKIVLTTGNKSEMSVGYATLYGDMAGGFCVLKDVPKTLVYEMARYRNLGQDVIPQRVIERAPSAELAPDQKDEDSLPPYSVLDVILERYVEQDQCAEDIIAAGFEAETVYRVIGMVDRNEYKRRQAPPGVRITQRAFGRDRRYPITSGYGRIAPK